MTAPTLENMLAFRPSRRTQARTNRGPAPLIRTSLPEPRQPRHIEIPDWWTCAVWCTDCDGGQKIDFGSGRTTITQVAHRGVVLNEEISDDGGNPVRVVVEVGVIEDHDCGYMTAPFVIIPAVATPDLDAALRIATAIESAVHHARQELPTITRSSSHGGGRASTPLEAS